MARLLAIDYGLKRTGLAVTDPGQVIASPLTVIHPKDLMNFLSDYLGRETVEGIVLGFPVRLDQSQTDITARVRQIAGELRKKFPQVVIYLHDERFTSAIARDAMIRGGSSKKARREKMTINKVSAAVILQSFLEQKAIRGADPENLKNSR